MARAAEKIVVEAPLSAVYNQWTQFEEFPRFMDAVEEVHQLDDRRLHWKADLGGRHVEWDAEIQEQIPDTKIVWRSVDGATNAGMVEFRPVDSGHTEVRLEMSYEPEGFAEWVGDALGFVSSGVKNDLKEFKQFLEGRDGLPTGAWRGEIVNPNVPGGHTRGRGSADL